MAYRLGDPTAKEAGRLSLNPIKHIDPIGLISLTVLRFGWAKPVPYDPRYFKNQRQGTLLVAIAGPVTNILLGLLSLIAMVILDFDYSMPYIFFEMMFIYNIMFAVFNSLPIPPLDGSKVLASLLPDFLGTIFWKYEKYGYIVLLLLIFTNLLGIILNPGIEFLMNALISLVQLFI